MKYLLILILFIIGCADNKVPESMDERLEYYEHGTLLIDKDGYKVKYFTVNGNAHFYVTPQGSMADNPPPKKNDD